MRFQFFHITFMYFDNANAGTKCRWVNLRQGVGVIHHFQQECKKCLRRQHIYIPWNGAVEEILPFRVNDSLPAQLN